MDLKDLAEKRIDTMLQNALDNSVLDPNVPEPIPSINTNTVNGEVLGDILEKDLNEMTSEELAYYKIYGLNFAQSAKDTINKIDMDAIKQSEEPKVTTPEEFGKIINADLKAKEDYDQQFAEYEKARTEDFYVPTYIGKKENELLTEAEFESVKGATTIYSTEEAHKLIFGDREKDYGSATKNFTDIAKGWSVIFGTEVTAEQVCIAMTWLKLCRLIKSPAHRDSVVDGIGYLAIIQDKLKNGL